MSFMYDRKITISRAAVQTGAGLQSYGGDIEAAETVVISGLMASMQPRRSGQRNQPGLPLDGTKAEWHIYFRMPSGCDPTLVQDRDFVTDDLARRFQVISAYPSPLGFALHCIRMEA